ncbi:cadherin-like beta sandwich domain-containing protein [Bacteroidota bacterium]
MNYIGKTVLSGVSSAADIPVKSGASIQDAIDGAADGDVIVLTDGGVYEGNLEIIKSITLKAADGADVRPLVTGRCWFTGAKGIELKIKGIEFSSGGEERYFIRLNQTPPDSVAYLELTDLVVHGYDRSLIRASDAGQFLDSVLIDNCHFYDFHGSDYRLIYIDGDDCPTRYFKAVNSTFEGFDRNFIQITSSVKKTVIIDHCNVHRRTDIRDDDLFDVTGAAGTSFTLSNSIISDIRLDKIWDLRDNVTDSIMNCYFFEVDSAHNMTSNTWSYESAFTEQDPMFTNGPDGALYLDAASPALTASTTGGAIGDPRWLVAPTAGTLFRLIFDAGYLTSTFVDTVYDYTAKFPIDSTSITVNALTSYAADTVTGTGVVDVSSGTGVATLVVTAADASTRTYTISFEEAVPSADASLSSLTIDVGTLAPDFNKATYAYTAVIPSETTSVIVDADASDNNATVTGADTIDVSSGSGVATIVVLAEDSISTLTYTITMTVIPVGIDGNPASDIRLYHNSSINQLRIFNSSDVEMLEVYSITGRLLSRMRIHNQESLYISTGNIPKGVYLVRMKLSSNKIQTGKFIK